MAGQLGKALLEHYSKYELVEERAQEIITSFMNRYFGETREVISFELRFIKENELIAPKIDYFKLRRFLGSAINNLKEMDHSLLSGTLGLLYNDVESLFDFYATFESKTKIASVVFERDFLYSIPEYKYLKQEKEDAEHSKRNSETAVASAEKKLQNIKDIDGEEFKKIRRSMADNLYSASLAKDKISFLSDKLSIYHTHLKDRFIDIFENEKNQSHKALQIIINTKSVYLDHLLWHQAEKSLPIQRFFKKSDIKGDYDTKTYIEYYMRNINIEQSKDVGWHQYLKDIMKLFDG